jgi:large subunit ribosomal protein L6
MSRVAKNPVQIPKGVDVSIAGDQLNIKGGKGALAMKINGSVAVAKSADNTAVTFEPRDGSKHANAMAGTTRALVKNMVTGVTEGFQRKMSLVGVGYRANAQGKMLNLSLGYSHPVNYTLPDGVTAETPTQTEILLKSANKQLLGQVASEVRAFRPPEPYKGKGVRYADEKVHRKEAKKK